MRLNIVLLICFFAFAGAAIEAQYQKRVNNNRLYQVQQKEREYLRHYELLRNQHTDRINFENIKTVAVEQLQMVPIDVHAKKIGSISQALMTEKEVAEHE